MSLQNANPNKTEQTCTVWILRYVRFHGAKTHPRNMGKAQIEAFLSHLASEKRVSAATQRQALNAIMFLYKRVLDVPIEGQIAFERAKRRPRLPVVLTQNEVQRVLDKMQGAPLLMARILYGAGLRLMECVRLRVKDVDLERLKIYVFGAKGNKDRITVMPRSIADDLQHQID